MSGSSEEHFAACEICGAKRWAVAYRGAIRDGVFQRSRPDAIVGRCGNCGVERLSEHFCLHEEDYQTWEYRSRLGQEQNIASHLEVHDRLQKFAVDVLWPESLRGKTVADIGCAGGALLDHLRGVAERCIGVEPASFFRDYIQTRGIETYVYAKEAAQAIPASVDVAFSLQVIEHTDNPRAFLSEILPLLKPEGSLLISTPNRQDILMDLLPGDFPSFFYRTAHRWYFDAESLSTCARLSGFEPEWMRGVHRYGLSNAMAWLRDRRPSGWQRLPGIEPIMDAVWKSALEQAHRADTLFVRLRPARR